MFENLHYRLRVIGLILLGCLLVILAGLQYRWLNEISQAEIHQTRTHLETAINHLACQFDLEIARAMRIFPPMPGPEAFTPQQQAAAEAWSDWQRRAPHPELLRNAVLLHWAHERWTPIPVSSISPPSEDIAAVVRNLPAETGNFPGQRAIVAAPNLLMIRGNPVVVQPRLDLAAPSFMRYRTAAAGTASISFGPVLLPPDGPMQVRDAAPAPQVSWLILTFDREYVLRELLPRLVRENLASVAQTEYALRIHSEGRDETISASGATLPAAAWRTADVTAPLFRSRFECSVDMPPGAPVFSMSGGVAVSTRAVEAGGTLRKGPGFFTAVQPPPVVPEGASWQLMVRHRSGSLERAFADFRRRNLFVSTGVLLILAVSIATLTLSAERARILAKAQTEMAIGLSHELKTPLTALRIAAANLKSGAVKTEEQASRYGSVIDDQSRRLMDLVENTLHFARAQPTVSRLVCTAIIPQDIVRIALENRAAELERAGMQVEMSMEILPPIRADAPLLTHCLENLIDNAIKYASQGAYLGVRARACNRGRQPVVRIAVEDRGSGIARGDLPYIFEPFYRGLSTRSARSNGVGLGLAFVKRVIASHGGRVEVQSSQAGTTFALELPAFTLEKSA